MLELFRNKNVTLRVKNYENVLIVLQGEGYEQKNKVENAEHALVPYEECI